MDIYLAVQHLVSTTGLKLPYGLLPGTYPGGNRREFSEREWAGYPWNPPRGMRDRFPDRDPDASPKPTWEQLEAAHAEASLPAARRRVMSIIRAEETRRICEQYLDGHLRTGERADSTGRALYSGCAYPTL